MRTCSIEGCDEQHTARGWCKNHYYVWKRHGHPEGKLASCFRCKSEWRHAGRGRPFRLCSACREHFGICRDCDEALPIENFAWDGSVLRVRCRSCDAVHRRKSVRVNTSRPPEVVRKHNLARYGLTAEQWQQMFDDQQGRCAICGDEPEKLVVDHCHAEGHVRSLLCGSCNKGLGYFRDDPLRLAAAIRYLHTSTKVQAIR